MRNFEPSIRPTIRLFCLVAGVLLGLASTAIPGPRLNVLFIVADDLHSEPGCHGVDEVRTEAHEQKGTRS